MDELIDKIRQTVGVKASVVLMLHVIADHVMTITAADATEAKVYAQVIRDHIDALSSAVSENQRQYQQEAPRKKVGKGKR